MTSHGLLPILIAGLSASGLANAVPSLIGDSVTVAYRAPAYSNVFTSDVVTVGSGPEILCPSTQTICTEIVLYPMEFLDIGALTISGHFENPDPFPATDFAGFSFEGLDFGSGEMIVGVSLSTDIVGLTASRISFSAYTLNVNLTGLSPVGDFTVSLDVAPVPEPSSWALICAGLTVLAASARRRAGVPVKRG